MQTDQLSEIRKTTFAAIICDNSDEIESVQLHVMHSARKVGNARVGCDSLIKTSLDPWKEELAAPQDPTATPPQVDLTTAAQDSTTAAEVTTSNNNGSQSAEVLQPATIVGTANR